MIYRVILGLAGIAFFATVRGWRRRRRDAAARKTPVLTVSYGDTGLENTLYRVAIECGAAAAGRTFTWSRDGDRDSVSQPRPVQTGAWIPLENGVEICFEGEAFLHGDFWTFPARSAADTVTMKARRRGSPSARGRAKRRR